MDSERKSGYYVTILSDKKNHGSMERKYSKALCELTVSTKYAGKLICFSEH